MTHPALRHPTSDYINGQFVAIPGEAIVSINPAEPDSILWTGMPNPDHVDLAVEAARDALPNWSELSLNDRADVLRRWAEVTSAHVDDLASLITDEMGKILAESIAEAKALGDKVNITLENAVLNRTAGFSVDVTKSRAGHCRFKPHGVMAVIGPFNFPAHLPNGHFIPAMLMGNTIVFKPSEKTPAVGQMMAELMHDAGVPPGVFNVIQGGGNVAARCVTHDDIDGILFTGSWTVGRKILQANLDRPGRIIALEMGGNNPSVILDDANLKQAVIETVRASFATTGQRCTCTRRIIVQRGIADSFVHAFCKATSTLIIGPGRSADPVFMGPLISDDAVQHVIDAQSSLASSGARILMQATAMDRPGSFISPGIAEVDGFTVECDEEVFGPFVQIAVVDDLDEAIGQANQSRYGLAASIFTQSDSSFEHFFRHCRAGCINRNTGTAGASSRLPFGGIGHSGNHRPAGTFSLDYSAYPVASLVESAADVAVPSGMAFDDRWIRQ